MSLIGQPDSYSDMLKRIFVATLTVGLLCTLSVAATSPAASTFFESWKAEVSIGILESVKALYVLVPLFVAVLARVFLLHDKVSAMFGIRKRFDIQYILMPLAKGVGFPTEGAKWKHIEDNRRGAMTRVFYPYASFINPKIDIQLVRTAADRWAWFWSAVEPQIILVITAIIFVWLRAWTEFFAVLSGITVLMLIGFALWPQLRDGAMRQIAEILDNDSRKTDILAAFQDLSLGAGPATK